MQDYHNFYYEQSYKQSYEILENTLVTGSFEKRTLRKLLQNFTYEDFVKMSSEWLRNARFVWFVHGNIAKETAITLVEKAVEIFGSKGVEKEDLADVRCVALPA